MHSYTHLYIYICVYFFSVHTHTHTHTHTRLVSSHHVYHRFTEHSCFRDVSVAEWLAWLTSNCGRISAIGSSPSNGLKPNLLGQKGFNPLCQCVYVYVCIVNPDIQTIHRCSHTSIHTSQSQVCPQGQAR